MSRRKEHEPTRPKMSGQIQEMAGDFVSVGRTLEDRHRRLNAACFAWNIACVPPLVRRRQLQEYGAGYQRHCPGTSDADLANILKDMQLLVDRKLELFPDDRRQIVDARVVPVGENYRIEVVSARAK